MEVKLISITQSQIQTKDGSRFLTPEEHIVYCARVSNPSNQLNIESAPKLLKYCINNHHWSIFEQCTMGVEIITSRAIAQQIIRHRSFSFQEFSQRYAEVQTIENFELRKQAEKNRQSSAEIFYTDEFQKRIVNHLDSSVELYKDLINAGVAKESARFILPLSTETRLFMLGTVRSWIHYLKIRNDHHTQKEHRDIAKKIDDIFKIQFPNTSEALSGIDS